ncbi:MAG: TonB family protein [Syntrophorhabdales bacterium]
MYYWQFRYNWIKFAVIALAIHGVVLSLPLSRNAPQALKERLIDVVVMRQEAPPAPPPAEKVEPRPAPKRVALKETAPAPRVKERMSEGARPLDAPIPREPQPLEKKAEAPGAGAGNVLDEQIASQVVPGPGAAGDEGVGIAGVNTAGGKVGLGGGGTGVGIGTGRVGTGTGSGGGSGGGGGGGVVQLREPPAFAYYEEPEYTVRARRLGKEGKVALELTIDEKGKVVKVDVVEATDQMFVVTSVSAAKRWRFKPAKKDSVPVACRAPVTIPFRMQE